MNKERISRWFSQQLHYMLILLLVFIWILHFTGVLVPETGFDAVWYHLPVIGKFVEAGKIYFIPELYQSANPLLSDLIFGVGYVLGGELGSKVVAYFFGLGLAFASYFLSRKFLSKEWSLVVVIGVSLFQVVTWQSASFYVDVAKGFWEVAALFLLISEKGKPLKYKSTIWSGVLFGASLATKLFSLFLLPVFLLLVYLATSQKRIQHIFLFMLSAFIISGPFFFYTYSVTGNPLYSFMVHTESSKFAELSGTTSPVQYFFHQLFFLPKSLVELSVFAHDYTSILFLVFSGLFLRYLPSIWQDKKLRLLLLFASAQYGLWWFLPPPQTRYALSGFVVLFLLLMIVVRNYGLRKPEAQVPILLTIALAFYLNILPRLGVVNRNLKYILGEQTKKEYIEQFYDGNIDQHLKKWHHIE